MTGMRSFAAGLATGVLVGVAAGWAPAPRAPGAGTPGAGAPSDAASDEARAAEPLRRPGAPEREAARRRAHVAEHGPPSQEEVARQEEWTPFADQGTVEETKDIATWPLERLLGVLRAELRRTSFGPHGGVGAFRAVHEVRRRFPEVELPVELARAFASRPAHYPNAARAVRETWSAATLASELAGFEREGAADQAAHIASLLGPRDEPALARLVERWLRSDDPRLRLQGVECWVHAPSVPASLVVELALHPWPDDPTFGNWIVRRLVEVAPQRPDLDPAQMEQVVVAAIEVPELRRTATLALGRLGGRGHEAAMRRLSAGDLAGDEFRSVAGALVLAGRTAELIATGLPAEEIGQVVWILATLDRERYAAVRAEGARLLRAAPVPDDAFYATSYFRLLTEVGDFEAAVRAVRDAKLRSETRAIALRTLVTEAAWAGPALECAREILTAPDSSPELRHAVVATLSSIHEAHRASARALAAEVGRTDPSAWVREQATSVAEGLARTMHQGSRGNGVR